VAERSHQFTFASNPARLPSHCPHLPAADAIPHHSAIADGEAALVYKVSRIELRGGFKGFYFKTTPKGDFYMRGRLVGGVVGIRLYLGLESPK